MLHDRISTDYFSQQTLHIEHTEKHLCDYPTSKKFKQSKKKDKYNKKIPIEIIFSYADIVYMFVRFTFI